MAIIPAAKVWLPILISALAQCVAQVDERPISLGHVSSINSKYAVAFGDINNDGALDVVYIPHDADINCQSSSCGSLRYEYGLQPNGTFKGNGSEADLLPINPFESIWDDTVLYIGVTAVFLKDVNDDSQLDLVVAVILKSGTNRIVFGLFPGNGDFTFSSFVRISAEVRATAVKTVFVDRYETGTYLFYCLFIDVYDENLYLFWQLNHTEFEFDEMFISQWSSDTLYAVADINRDNILDRVELYYGGERLKGSLNIYYFADIQMQRSNGTAEISLNMWRPSYIAKLEAFVIEDLNNDGDADFIFAEFAPKLLYTVSEGYGIRIKILLSTGDIGKYSLDFIYVESSPYNNIVLSVFDVGGDEDLDIVLAYFDTETNSTTVKFIENAGSGSMLFRSTVLLAMFQSQNTNFQYDHGDVQAVLPIDVEDGGGIDTLAVLATKCGNDDCDSEIFTLRIGTSSVISPTAVVTGVPTPLLTENPTQVLTEVPTMGPTSVPSPAVTLNPTDDPTPVSTGSPTSGSTRVQIPTPTPTLHSTETTVQVSTPLPDGICSPLLVDTYVANGNVEPCNNPISGSTCQLKCAEEGAQAPGLGIPLFRCIAQSSGGSKWEPSVSDLLPCTRLCPEFPPPENKNRLEGSCSPSSPNHTCSLNCPAHLVPSALECSRDNVVGKQTCDNFDAWQTNVICHDNGKWYRSEDTTRSMELTYDSLLKCTDPVCNTTIGLRVEGIVCDFDLAQNIYETHMPFERNKTVSFFLGENEERVDYLVKPGSNYWNRTYNGTVYVFRVIMAPPSDLAHITQLQVHNFTLETPFAVQRSHYKATYYEWSPIVSFDISKANFATVRCFSVDSEERLSTIDPLDSNRPYSYSTIFSMDVVGMKLEVEAQSGLKREYIIELSRRNAESCYEQLICQSSGYIDCALHCEEASRVIAESPAGTIELGWSATLVLGIVCAVIFLVMTVVLRKTFHDFSLQNTCVFVLCTSIFDSVNDLFFIVFLFSEGLSFYAAVATTMYLVAAAINAYVMVYAVHRELTTSSEFRTWHLKNSIIAAFVGFVSLGNAESFMLVGIGRDLTPYGSADKAARTEHGIRAHVAQSIQAPLSKNLVKHLRWASWAPLILDDLGFTVIQLVIVYSSSITLGGIIYLFLSVNLCIITLRIGMILWRTLISQFYENVKKKRRSDHHPAVNLTASHLDRNKGTVGELTPHLDVMDTFDNEHGSQVVPGSYVGTGLDESSDLRSDINPSLQGHQATNDEGAITSLFMEYTDGCHNE